MVPPSWSQEYSIWSPLAGAESTVYGTPNWGREYSIWSPLAGTKSTVYVPP